jgi:hypothetical protein
MSEGSRQIVKQLQFRLRRVARRMLLARALFGMIVTLAAGSAAWFALVALEVQFWFGPTVRTVAVPLLGAGVLVALGILVLPSLLRLVIPSLLPAEHDVALRVGQRYPEIGDRLASVLDLAQGRGSIAPASFVDSAIGMLDRRVSGVPFEGVEDFSRPRKAGLMAGWIPLVLAALMGVAPDSFRAASGRLLAFTDSFEQPAPFTLTVFPGDVERSRGEPLEISVEVSGSALPASASLYFVAEDTDYVDEASLAESGPGRFLHRFDAIRTPMRYRVEADGVSSEWFHVSVVDRPFVRDLTIEIAYPSYTGLPPSRFTGHRGEITALRGSTVNVVSTVGGPPVRTAGITFGSGDHLAMDVGDGIVSASFQVLSNDEYAIVLEAENAVANIDPIRYPIRVVDDEPPAVAILAPEADHVLSENLEARLAGRVSDDYGFSRLELVYRLAESRYRSPQQEPSVLTIPMETPRPREQDIGFLWRLGGTSLDPVPGDVIEYHLRVWDNDGVSGSKSARSATQRIRIPSLADRYRETDERQDQLRDDMERLIDDAEDFRREFEQFRNDVRSTQEADWQNQRQAEALQQRQEDMQRRADQMAREMEALTRDMERDNLLSPETIATYRELQRVIEEINSPELFEALKNLQEALQELNLDQMQESMQNFEFNEQQYQQRLERTLELFKRARAIQQLEQAERMAQEIARQQEELKEATEQLDADVPPHEGATPDSGDEPDRDRVADEQSRLADDVDELEDKLKDVGDQLREIRRSDHERLEQLREELRGQELPERMKETGEQIRNSDPNARQGQQSAQEQLEELQQNLNSMRSGMQGAQMNLNLSGLRRTLRDVIQLSRDQEGMQKATVQQGAGSPGLRDMARGQMRLAEGVGVVADSLQSLAGQIPQMSRNVQRHTGDALREMQRATEALSDRSSREASTRQRSSMMHLNELALMLSDLMDQLMNQQAGEGEGGMSTEEMAQQLQQMSEQQRSLNRQIQDFLNETHGQRMSVDQEARLRQMAAQQDEIRRQLRQLGREQLAHDQALNDLNRIAEQMGETIRELERRGASREMIERQQQILTRLLEAENSLQQRGEDEQRRGRSGDQQTRPSPPEIERQREIETLRRDLIRALESDYAQDYQELIRRYFDLLRREVERE